MSNKLERIGLNGNKLKRIIGPMAVEKIKILGAVLELPAKQHCQFSPFGPIFEVWQCYLAGSSKRVPRILSFSSAMGANKLFYVKSIALYAPTFFGYTISVLALKTKKLTKWCKVCAVQCKICTVRTL